MKSAVSIGRVVLFFHIFGAAINLCRAVINGTVADVSSYPFIVSLQWDERHKCGGTLLDSTTVLTAGHCIPLLLVNPSEPQRVSVLAGASNQLNPQEASARRVGVAQFIWHPCFPVGQRGPQIMDQPIFDIIYDYALLKLATPVLPGPNVSYARLPSTVPSSKQAQGVCTVLGWGRFATPDVGPARSERFSPQLRRGMMKMINDASCIDFLKAIPTTMACVKPIFVAGQSQGMLCFGDSGSPVICNDSSDRPYLAGLAEAAVIPCNIPQSPALLMRIEPIHQWILQQMERQPRTHPNRPNSLFHSSSKTSAFWRPSCADARPEFSKSLSAIALLYLSITLVL